MVLPILIPLNYINGRGHDLDPSAEESSAGAKGQVMGLDTLSFGNVRSSNTKRYTAHLVCAVLVIVWFCYLSFIELSKWGNTRCDSIDKDLQAQNYLVNKFKDTKHKELAKQIEHLLEERSVVLDKFEEAATALARRNPSIRVRQKAEHYGNVLNKLDNTALNMRVELEKAQYRPCPGFMILDGVNHKRRVRCDDCVRMAQSWRNILWQNVGLTWLERMPWIAGASIVLGVMIAFCAMPVSVTAALGQFDNLVRNPQLRSYFQRHETLRSLLVSIAGVLPGLALALMLMFIPPALEYLSLICGATQRCQQAAFVQRFYFVILFIQMFLVVSIASFFTSSFHQYLHNLATLKSARGILNLLSQNLPTAANYFFSCMILQSLAGSANILMQRTPLFWFFVDKLYHYTPRQKWSRRDRTDIVGWGGMFPLYTTLACISLAYSAIAPLISFFAIISFAMLWGAHRYSVMHVKELGSDHGGILYPRAINQTFTGVYVMALCMAGLFLGVRDDTGRQSCVPHGIVMIVALVLTGVFQVAINIRLWAKLKAKCATGRCNSAHHEHLGTLLERSTAWVPATSDKFGVRTKSTYPLNDMAQKWNAEIDQNGRVQIAKLTETVE